MQPIRNPGCLFIASLFLALSCSGVVAQIPSAGSGQAYPAKPVRLILPFPPGAPNDTVGRALGQKLSEQLGENVVPENRPGAGGNVGIGVAAMSAPDGYTLVLATPEIVARLNREVTRALESPDLRKQLAAMGVDPWPGTPERLASLVHSETARYAKVIKSIGLRLD